MTGKTHRIGGIAFGTIASFILLKNQDILTTSLLSATIISGSALGSLIPDIDHKGSIISKKMKLLSWIVRKFTEHRGITHYGITLIIFSIFLFVLHNLFLSILPQNIQLIILAILIYFSISSLFKLIPRKYLNKKQKFIISIFCGICIPILISNKGVSVLMYYFIGLSVGYFSHLMLDALTVTGIPLLGHKTKFKLANFKTGENENIVQITSIFITLVVIFLIFM